MPITSPTQTQREITTPSTTRMDPRPVIQLVPTRLSPSTPKSPTNDRQLASRRPARPIKMSPTDFYHLQSDCDYVRELESFVKHPKKPKNTCSVRTLPMTSPLESVLDCRVFT
uniref:Uncharacterized protein n=1 Tax=Panagrellus redivivus TaxID=6233 RepID=A0A7E4ZS03_PANRE